MNLDHLVANANYPATMGSDRAPFLADLVWLEHRATFARSATEKDYLLLSRIFAAISLLRELIAQGSPLSPAPPDLLQDAANQQRIAAFAYKHLTGKDWDEFRRESA